MLKDREVEKTENIPTLAYDRHHSFVFFHDRLSH